MAQAKELHIMSVGATREVRRMVRMDAAARPDKWRFSRVIGGFYKEWVYKPDPRSQMKKPRA